MLNINKIEILDEFDKFVKKDKPNNWGELDSKLKAKLNNHIVENEQTINNISYCVYCEKKIISEKSHIEHIKPRDNFNKSIFDYNNLVVSCMTKDSCGTQKENKYFDEFISPVEDIPREYFSYLENGEIYSTDENAIKTYNILNLNNKKLKQARQTIILQLQDINDLEYYDDFPSLLDWIKDTRL